MTETSRDCRHGLKLRQRSQETMNEALRAVRGWLMGVTLASRDFNIPWNTLTDRIKHKVRDDCGQIGRNTALTAAQDDLLCKFIEYMAGRGFPLPNHQDVECQTDPMDIELLPTSAIKLHSSNSQKSKLTCSKSF